MANQPAQVQDSREKIHTQHHGAHSGSHAGGSDYNDGGLLSHYGGNDDYIQDEEGQEDFDGQVAYGNENESPEEDEDQYGKYHSGL